MANPSDVAQNESIGVGTPSDALKNQNVGKQVPQNQVIPQFILDYVSKLSPEQRAGLSPENPLPGWAQSQQSSPASSTSTTPASDTSGQENNAAANAAKTPAPASSPTGSPMFDPMAINAFYAMGIAPMFQQLQTNLGDQNALYTQMAQNIANKYAGSLPPGFANAMAGTIPQMGAAQNDVIASMMGAQLSGSAFDQLMNNINANKTAQEAAYRQLLSNPSLSSLGQAAGQLPGGVPAQGTSTPFALPAPGAIANTDPLVAAGVLPPPGSP